MEPVWLRLTIAVFGYFPFTSDELESQTTHKISIEQIGDSASAVHSAAIKPAAQAALAKIRWL